MNTVFVNEKYILFLQSFGATEKHQHDTCHLTISLDGKMHCKIEEKAVDCYGYILNSNVDHQRFGENADSIKLVFVFEPCAGELLSAKSKLLEKKSYVELTAEQYEKVFAMSRGLVKMANEGTDWQVYLTEHSDTLVTAISEILKTCGIKKDEDFHIDERVAHLIRRMRQEETIENNMLDEVCQEVSLSKSRLLHLFKESTGVSLKKYMQYIKFFKTWRYMAEGENITKACIHAGYSDSAHYTNFMKQCYGLSTKQELTSISGIYLLD